VLLFSYIDIVGRNGGRLCWRATRQPRGSNKRIVEVQKTLHRSGYLNSEPDFVYGPETRAAILKFQKEKNLTETQLPDNATLETLRKITW